MGGYSQGEDVRKLCRYEAVVDHWEGRVLSRPQRKVRTTTPRQVDMVAVIRSSWSRGTYRGAPITTTSQSHDPGHTAGISQPLCRYISGTPCPYRVCLVCPEHTGQAATDVAAGVPPTAPSYLFWRTRCQSILYVRLPTKELLRWGGYGCRLTRRSAIVAGGRLPGRILGVPPWWARRPTQAALNSSSVPHVPRCATRAPR